MKKRQLPKGWTPDQIRALAERHDRFTLAEQVAEIEAAFAAGEQTVMKSRSKNPSSSR